jgi:protein associated with RNAse G/E
VLSDTKVVANVRYRCVLSCFTLLLMPKDNTQFLQTKWKIVYKHKEHWINLVSSSANAEMSSSMKEAGFNEAYHETKVL